MRIRTKVFISLLVTAMIPLVILGVFAYSKAFGGLRIQILGGVRSFASVQAQRVSDLISFERTQLALVCSRTQLRLLLDAHLKTSSEDAVGRMDKIVSDAKESLGSFESISITGPDGVVIATTDPALRGSSIDDREAFEKALSGEFVHGHSAEPEPDGLKIAVMGPLRLQGRIIGVAVVSLRPDDLGAALRTLREGHSESYLVEVQEDDLLQILAPPEKVGEPLGIRDGHGGRQITGSENRDFPDAVTADGIQVISAIRAIPRSELAVVVSVPKDDAMQPVYGLRNVGLIILSAASGFALVVALVLARSITDPITALAESANHVEQGDLYEEADESAPGEIGILAKSFNRMTGKLLRANRQLEVTVAERTGELESAQMLLIQTEKMDSLGRLAAGVAHEVKNPLAVIQMGVEYLKNNVGNHDSNTRNIVDGMEEAVEKADSTIHGMLDLTRAHGIERSLADTNQLVDKALGLAAHELKKRKITVHRDFEDALPQIRVDRPKFEQVFINIITNAAHAMDNDGDLYVKTSQGILGEVERNMGLREFDRLRKEDNVVVVEFRDTGPGIPKDQLQKIFEPFYTTKAPGEGTGLGLGIIKTIVDLHHGDVQIDNHPDGGARVRVIIKVSGASSIR